VQINYVLTIIVVCIATTACTSLPLQNCKPGEKVAIQDSLYFGTGKKDGVVTHEDWTLFLDTTVTPRFPEGFTVVPASGQWQSGDDVIIKESSYILTLIHPDTQDKEHAVIEITKAYKMKFQQEAVLRVTNTTCVSF
jgi:hypothetical protein